MRLSTDEREARRAIDDWSQRNGSPVSQLFNWAMQPVDWVVERSVSPDMLDRAETVTADALAQLSDMSARTGVLDTVLTDAQEQGIDVDAVEALREESLDTLDPLARKRMQQNALIAALEGGGTGLGGAALILADIPLLFTINFRVIQTISACYGFPMHDPTYRPLVMAMFTAAASGSRAARSDALREASVAAAALVHDHPYSGRRTGTFHEQNRHVPREIAKALIRRKVGQLIPLAGAAVGAGVNYWFTKSTAETAFMCSRALYLDWKERRR